MQQNRRPTMGRSLSAIVLISAVCGIGLSACASPPQPVDKPCGVITDDLGNVHATTTGGEKRISQHFERGVEAGCWDRSGATKSDLSRRAPQ